MAPARPAAHANEPVRGLAARDRFIAIAATGFGLLHQASSSGRRRWTTSSTPPTGRAVTPSPGGTARDGSVGG